MGVWEGEERRGELKCNLHTDIHTYRPSDEAGCRGAFAPKNTILERFLRNLPKTSPR